VSDVPIQSLWIGKRLGVMERLCIRSFLCNGHEFHLYLYDPCEGVPSGTVVKDARDILPREEIFCFSKGFGKGSPVCFSDVFRYHLLERYGGWWVDLDIVCLQPFRSASEHVFGLSNTSSGRQYINTAVIRLPSGSQVARECIRAIPHIEDRATHWGAIGPALFSRTVRSLGLAGSATPPQGFYPVDSADVRQIVARGAQLEGALGVHLWHSLWKNYGLNPDGRYAEGSLYETLISRYLPEANRESRPQVNLTAAFLRSIPSRAEACLYWGARRMMRRLKGGTGR
jgi:hypothetical protein